MLVLLQDPWPPAPGAGGVDGGSRYAWIKVQSTFGVRSKSRLPAILFRTYWHSTHRRHKRRIALQFLIKHRSSIYGIEGARQEACLLLMTGKTYIYDGKFRISKRDIAMQNNGTAPDSWPNKGHRNSFHREVLHRVAYVARLIPNQRYQQKTLPP